MPSEEVIELSVEETNKLRAELGLKPLRLERAEPEMAPVAQGSEGGDKKGDEEALELSVEETNKLREKLGLAPLRVSESNGSKKKEIHKPAENTGLQEEASQRIEQARLRRQVEDGATKVFGSSTLGLNDKNDGDGGLSWADKMRKQKAPKPKKNKKSKQQKQGDYSETDLEGMQVKNSMAGLEAGENAVLTLADTEILETKTLVSSKVVGLNQEEDALENIQLTENEKQRDGLRKKRMLEMGMGRAGGYAGFDDDEFEELGGTIGPSSQQRGMSNENTKSSRGFRLGSQANSENTSKTDFDKVMAGEAVSLVWKGDVVSSDYMTKEEEEELKRKKPKKEAKFKKKKKHKKDKKKRRRTTEDDEEEEQTNYAPVKAEANTSGTSLLSKLESTADSNQSSSLQKRRKVGDLDEDDDDKPSFSNTSSIKIENVKGRLEQTNRSSYDKAMEKGNVRTNNAFNTDRVAKEREDTSMLDEEPDDSFLNAALAKARRLNRLRKMNQVSSTGADAVAEAVKSSSVEAESSNKSSGISFSIDDTREFSRAIRARTQQKERKAKKEVEETTAEPELPTSAESNPVPQTSGDTAMKPIKQEDVEEDVEMEEADLQELAKEVKEDDIEYGLDGSTAKSAGVGRGLSSFVSMLKTTGEITGKHGGKEELRGRAKDERNYDNYEPMDLSKVVSIGEGASAKDQEFAKREIKLEYRDKHGRLLTQKEAYRDLCYQFHGHGASKKNEEKRLRQIAREQAEARTASRTAGTLGALQATQKATGKAYISHKT